MKYKKLITILFVFILISCDKFDYSHYQVLEEDYKNLNQKNISRFIDTITDTITIAVIGDSQRFYDATGKVIKKINSTPNINFVVHTGDLVDFGLQKEYIWAHTQFTTMNYPYVAVVGNHDLIGNGGEIYNIMYGDYNFSFTFNGNKFIYINTNSREFNFDGTVPDIQWLDYELSDTSNYKNAIIVCHVPHMNVDFDSNLAADFVNVLRKYKKVLLSLNGHNHAFSFTPPGNDNISYINTFSTAEENFVLVKIWGTNFSYEIVD